MVYYLDTCVGYLHLKWSLEISRKALNIDFIANLQEKDFQKLNKMRLIQMVTGGYPQRNNKFLWTWNNNCVPMNM